MERREPRAIGKRFGLLTIVDEAEPYRWRRTTKRRWVCECDCGNQTICRDDSIASGDTRSCGCEKIRISKEIEHGHRVGYNKTYEYDLWVYLKRMNANNTIDLPPSWVKKGGFSNFIADVSRRPGKGFRLRCEEGRSPRLARNWRWVADAPRRGVPLLWVKHKGRLVTLRELEMITKVKYSTLLKRHERGLLQVETKPPP